ncbi:MAG: hypothetical protein EA397_07140, partial [Deltaproteobacteria bacterium]
MQTTPLRLLLLPIGLSWLSLTGCDSDGDSFTDSACDDVVCGENASCDPRTGQCVCDTGFDFFDGECVDERLADCRDASPSNASPDVQQVTITYDGQRWSTPEDCEWSCDSGYGEHQGVCLSSRLTTCTDDPPNNASTTDSNSTVRISWDDDTGWETPPPCPWECDAGFGQVGEACLDARTVLCADEAPENATSDLVDVVVDYIEGEGFQAPQACEWSCDDGFGLWEGECLDSREVDCDASGTPSDATAAVVSVSVAYLGEGAWAEPESCEWSCDTGFGLWEGECLANRAVDCVDASPDNAHPTESEVTISYDPASGWPEAPECGWECNTDFGFWEGECLMTTMVQCDDDPPEDGFSHLADVEISWNDDAGTWSEPDRCEWSCDPGFGPWDDACLSVRTVECDDSDVPPENAVIPEPEVEISYDPESGWPEPPACDWSCEDGLGLWEGECTDTVTVACDDSDVPPENAVIPEPEVEISYDPESGWPEAPVCDWSCEAGFGLWEGECLMTTMVQCDDDPPEDGFSHLADVEISWNDDAGTWSEPDRCEWSCDPGFGPWDDACLSVRTVECDDSDVPPENAVIPEPEVEISYDPESGWPE